MTDGKNDTPYKMRRRTAEDEFLQFRDQIRNSPFSAHVDIDDTDPPPAPESTRLESGQVIRHHTKADCSGNCCLHGTSKHDSCRMPRSWRVDRGIIEHQCPHGVGHPCHAGIDYHNVSVASEANHDYDWGIHGCCGEGCCSMVLPPSDFDRLTNATLQTARNLEALIGVTERMQAAVHMHSGWIQGLHRNVKDHDRRITVLTWAFLFLAACTVIGFIALGV